MGRRIRIFGLQDPHDTLALHIDDDNLPKCYGGNLPDFDESGDAYVAMVNEMFEKRSDAASETEYLESTAEEMYGDC